jgi:hypothetical protein
MALFVRLDTIRLAKESSIFFDQFEGMLFLIKA